MRAFRQKTEGPRELFGLCSTPLFYALVKKHQKHQYISALANVSSSGMSPLRVGKAEPNEWQREVCS